ncbi:MAG TPA: RHS repeat-associated core domain-containing protein [Thermoanaerobaculia bacterium]|nr:RHS repeat-associated core domain-containing protein [Thermoanaerobaculia bacterium]
MTGTTVYGYDAAGQLVTTADANGATTSRTYDVLGRVTSSVSQRGAAPETVTWTYDTAPFGAGRPASMTDPTGETAFEYDHRGLLARETKTVGSSQYVTAFGYDPAGNRSRITLPGGRVVDFTFDFAGRPLTATSGQTSIVTAASYLPFGPATRLVLGNGTTAEVTFDARYRPVTNRLTGPLGTLAAYQYGHDAAGNVTTLHDQLDAGWNRDFGYDDLNRLTAADTGASLWGAGAYSYDAMGNLTTAQLGSATTAFAYQGTLPKLQTVTRDGVPRGIAYDAAGNETAAGSDVSDYSPRNSLAGFGGAQYLYDGRGIRTITLPAPSPLSMLDPAASGDGKAPAAPAGEPRPAPGPARGVLPALLSRVRFAPAGTASHSALSLSITARPVAHTGTAERHSLYTPELHLTAEATVSAGISTIEYEYVWFAGQPVAQIATATNEVSYYFNDHLGTPLLQTSSTGAVVWRVEREPYGKIFTTRVGAGRHQPLSFPGQEDDGSSDRSYNIFRWYRSSWGRYTQADPIGLRGGMNLYGYALQNPQKFIDPEGLKSKCSKACPDCPGGTWLTAGVDLGFTATYSLLGGLGYGASVGAFAAKCASASVTCVFGVICSKSFGVGVNVSLNVSGGASINAKCIEEIEGINWGVDVDVSKGSSGGSFEIDPGANVDIKISYAPGAGAAATFNLCDVKTLWCSK